MAGDKRVVLFTAQALLLGLLSGLLVIVANSVFIAEFGARQLPWTYIASAVGAMVGTPLLNRAVRRRTLAAIGASVWGGYGLLALIAWAALEWGDARWVSAPLVVMFPLGVIVGFFLIGGQAGRVFNLREMKEHFPRIVLGLPAGFIISGVLADLLIGVLGGVHRLLLMVTLTAVGQLMLMLVARRRFSSQLGTSERNAGSPQRLPLRKLVQNPFVVLLIGYQMLSQLGTQLVEFLVFERAGARYAGAEELGRFVARLMSVVNVVDLVFLLFVAGYVMRRFGMKVGLALNPALVTLLMLGAVVGGFGLGVGSTLVFGLIISARVFDIAFNDGATRTSLNTAYQAVPAEDRLAVQAATEVLGVPLALGITGVILLVLQQGLGVGPLGISILTVGVGVAWMLAGWFVFRGYRTNLRRGLESRVLDPASLELDDPSTVEVIDRMLAGNDERLVWLALAALGDHPELVDRLEGLALSGRSQVAGIAFEQLKTLDEGRAEEVARRIQTDASSSLSLDALGFLASRGTQSAADAVAAITRALDEPDRETRLAARRAAVVSGDAGLLARVVDDLVVPGDMVAAVAALSDSRVNLAEPLAAALAAASEDDLAALRAMRMLRCVRIPEGGMREVLSHHLQHPDRTVSLAVRQALGRIGGADDSVDVDALLLDDVAFAGRALAALEALPDDERLAVLRRGVQDEVASARERVLAALALTEDSDLMGHAARRLAGGDDRAIAHAVETVEVHLPPGRARLATPVLDNRLTAGERLGQLRRHVGIPSFDLPGALSDIADDPEHHWRSPWLAACALHASAELGLGLPEGDRWATRSEVAEVRAWAARRAGMAPA
jgi:hypothetical protein